MICFADLKKYKFTYLFAFPALHSEPTWKLNSIPVPQTPKLESDHESPRVGYRLSGQETIALVDAVQTWRYTVDARQYGFFLAKKKWHDACGNSGAEHSVTADGDRRPSTPGTPGDKLSYQWSIGPLASFGEGFFEGTEQEDRFVCFADPSTYEAYPGWMLRNLLALVGRKWKLNKVQILCYRDVPARRHEAHSIILQLEQQHEARATETAKTSGLTMVVGMPKATGWERNSAGKVMSRIANLGEYMDPQRLVIHMA